MISSVRIAESGSAGADEIEIFARLQAGFPEMYRRVFADPKLPRTVVVIPSLSLEQGELAKIAGVLHYEERLLCLLMLLRMPRTRIVYVTSTAIDLAVVDYYLHLLPGVPSAHARGRLTMLHVDDRSLRPLTAKILSRPDVIERIRSEVDRNPDATHMTCFSSTDLERTLAVRLGIPMYAPAPEFAVLGTKTAGRRLLEEVGMTVPAGVEGIRDRSDLVSALVAIARRSPGAERVVVKLDQGFSGEGNALVRVSGLEEVADPQAELHRRLEHELRCVATDETPEAFLGKLEAMGGIAEVLIEGTGARSPSVQVRIDPLGGVQLVSTHDQVLGGRDGQVFLGCTFPARPEYRLDLHRTGVVLGQALRERGVIGRFAVDFVSVPTDDGWRHHAIEINLRKGGTTLPYLMLEFLTSGSYDADSGRFLTPTGDERSYYATDNLVLPALIGRTPEELIDWAVYEELHFDASSQQGVVFHLMGAVTDHGKVGVVSIAPDQASAESQYASTVLALTGTPPAPA